MKLTKHDKETIVLMSNPIKKINGNIVSLVWEGGQEIYNVGDMSQIWTKKQQEYLDKRFGSLENRMNSLEQRMDNLERRMDLLEKRMDNLEKRMDILEQKLNLLIDILARNGMK